MPIAGGASTNTPYSEGLRCNVLILGDVAVAGTVDYGVQSLRIRIIGEGHFSDTKGMP